MVHVVQDTADLQSHIEAAGDLLVVIDFFATWCGPCKAISPKLDELATLYAEKIVVLKVDVDECEDIAMDYKISSMPTFYFIKQGKAVTHFSGGNFDKLEDTIKSLA